MVWAPTVGVKTPLGNECALTYLLEFRKEGE